jgi:serine phosphatase RsbU (regulator of sigma subunit)
VLNVTNVVTADGRSVIGYEFSTPSKYRSYVVYAETTLADRGHYAPTSENSSFSDLNYAVYLGREIVPANLVASSINQPLIKGLKATDIVPFGDNYFTLVVAPRASLISGAAEWRPWIIALLGLAIVGGAVVMVEKLARRRERAEELALELDRVAVEQRSIAQRLQSSLLPERLPDLDWLQMEALYIPATAEVDVGGDWYDAVVSGDEVLLVVGDVAGHGLQAATRMAYLRHSLLAYAAQNCSPASILANLSALVNADKESYFATVLCILVQREKGEITLASAGHPPPLLWDDAASSFIEFKGGVPLGISDGEPYEETTVSVSRSATLVAFTDGLVERPGEHLDIGLARLQAAAIGPPLPLHELLAKLVNDLAPADYHDDTAVVGIRWEQMSTASSDDSDPV